MKRLMFIILILIFPLICFADEKKDLEAELKYQKEHLAKLQEEFEKVKLDAQLTQTQITDISKKLEDINEKEKDEKKDDKNEQKP